MKSQLENRRIGIVGTYLPQKCGIATFTNDLHHAIQGQFPGFECLVIPVHDGMDDYAYPDEVRYEIAKEEPGTYRTAGEYLHFSDVDCVFLQHEYGIFGGDAGEYVLELVRRLEVPVLTTLHTVLENPDRSQRRVMDELAGLSSKLIVMAERARRMLEEIYGVSPDEISVIPHGIHETSFTDPVFFKDRFGAMGRKLLLTFGLLSPGKGIEFAIRAMPEILADCPDVTYLVLGATHPGVVRESGERYRESLIELAKELGVAGQVQFHDRFVELEELKEYIGAADIYLTPYLNPAQITSGTLAYAYGAGKAVVSTPYWHAQELLGDGRGVLVPFRDEQAIAREVIHLLKDEATLHAMRKRAYLDGKSMTWPRTAEAYVETFEQGRSRVVLPRGTRAPDERKKVGEVVMPELDLAHLFRLTDSTGIFQHAFYDMPDFGEGYCSDDNARALLLTILLEETGEAESPVRDLGRSYAAFLNHAFDRDRQVLRNFMGYDRGWREERGSDDSFGRFVWALGTCLGRSRRATLRKWSAGLFEGALGSVENSGSPRTWALSLLGLHEYFARFDGACRARELREHFGGKLFDLRRDHHDPEWLWFEGSLAYDNAKLPHALLVSGKDTGNHKWIDSGLESLLWLVDVQTSPEGWFRPIGSNGFFQRDEERAIFDQQPIEAHATVSACLSAWRITGDDSWREEANRAFAWFLGRNDLGQPLVCEETGGCFDGLHPDRPNENQGAESLLSFLLSLQEMRIAALEEEKEIARFEGAGVDRLASSEDRPSGRLASLPTV